MSGHPHKGKRSEWILCGTPPTMPGSYEYRTHLSTNIWVVAWDEGNWWIEWVAGDRMDSLKVSHSDQWRGLAEKPE